MERRVLEYRRAGLGLYVAGSALGAAACAFLMLNAAEIAADPGGRRRPLAELLGPEGLTIIGALGLLGCLVMIGLVIRRMVSGGEAAWFDEQGLTVNSLWRQHSWRWDEIASLGYRNISGNAMLSVTRHGGGTSNPTLTGIAGGKRAKEAWYDAPVEAAQRRA